MVDVKDHLAPDGRAGVSEVTEPKDRLSSELAVEVREAEAATAIVDLPPKDGSLVGPVQNEKSPEPKSGDKSKGVEKKSVQEGGKSKAQLKKERRELQERQRKLKAQAKTGNEPPSTEPIAKANVQGGDAKPPTTTAETSAKDKKEEEEEKKERRSSGKSRQKKMSEKSDVGASPSRARAFSGTVPKRVPDTLMMDSPRVEKRMTKKLAARGIPKRTSATKKVEMFSHLTQWDNSSPVTTGLPVANANIPPVVVQFGLRLANRMIVGSNARGLALISVLQVLIRDHQTPAQKEFARDFETYLGFCLDFLGQCRTLSVSMGNVVRFLKTKLSEIPAETNEDTAKKQLINELAQYADYRIIRAAKEIRDKALTKLLSEEESVILTFGWSSLVVDILKAAAQKSKEDMFRVVVVDSEPCREGKAMLRALVKMDIPVSYILLPAVQHVINRVTKVILGAHALLANGAVMSRAGASEVAMVAKEADVPVLVACETYKFTEQVQTDAFVFNELGNQDDVFSPRMSAEDKARINLVPLSLMYDVMQSDLVSAVITEYGMLPTSSVPVVLRLEYSGLRLKPPRDREGLSY
ncbi:unnamed protein product [Cyprideis torosa]|uniref:Translation initiation factor eIF2B subunit delta n=1 Tax=Cyprideis torosa TaxID=163714 RepID=A0A7R8ZNB7_9CRUS|nr:unnamed protein product [Cyprideis torosa]CAG0895886.1 unnamed protein product [Cyprideis torosa]